MTVATAIAAIKNAFRRYQTDGSVASGAKKPSKTEIRAGFDDLNAALEERFSSVEAVAAFGIAWTTQTIRVRSTGNINLSNALEDGDTLNGVTLATGDHVFLGLQTDPTANGIYTVVASGAASRATFADSAAELAQLGFVIQEGTAGLGERWHLPLAAEDISLGVTSLLFAPVGVEPGYAAEVEAARGGEASLSAAMALKAPLASPTFTGVPAAPTAAEGTSTTQIASTAFVSAAVAAVGTTLVPLHDDLAYSVVDEDGLFTGGQRVDGQLVTFSEAGVEIVGVGDDSVAVTDWQYNFNDTTGIATLAPTGPTARMFILNGQSLAGGTIDNADYAAATPYNSVAVYPGYALMPSVGLLVDTSFTALTDLLEQKNGNGTTVETVASEFAKAILEAWDAAGHELTPIIICAHFNGNTPIQEFMEGSPDFELLMTKAERCVAAYAAQYQGNVVVDGILYLQGEANRTDPERMTAEAFAHGLIGVRQSIEHHIQHRVTKQKSRVPMLVGQITRNSFPAEINKGATLATRLDPNIALNAIPCYAWEHKAGDIRAGHPIVAGYRRGGRGFARAALGRRYGIEYRPVEMRRMWPISATKIGIEVTLPRGPASTATPPTISKSGVDDLINPEGLDGDGFRLYDRPVAGANRELTVVSTGVDNTQGLSAFNAADSAIIVVEVAETYNPDTLLVTYATRAPTGTTISLDATAAPAAFTSVAAANGASTFTFAAGDPVAEGFAVGKLMIFAGLSEAANENVSYEITAIGGTSNRVITVTPAPTDMAADTTFAVTCFDEGRQGLGGSQYGPRGPYHANDGVAVDDLAVNDDSFLHPFEAYLIGDR